MNNQEAKFILGAYRPDGRDAGDPAFAAALEQAKHDPELRAWLEQQRKFDTLLAKKLQAVAPPPGLREAILTGARMSAGQARRRWWTQPGWLAVAAVLAVAAGIGVSVRPSLVRPTGAELAAAALRDLADEHGAHVGFPPELASVQAQLAGTSLPLAGNVKLDFEALSRNNCRALVVAGRPVLEVCFQRDGQWYHVYVGRRGDFAPGTFDPQALLSVRGEYASTAWADATHVYALVTNGGPQALQRVI